MMLCRGRKGQVDSGALVLSGLCWSLTSPPTLFCPIQCALAHVIPLSSSAVMAAASTASWSVMALLTAPMPPTRPPVKNVRPRRWRCGSQQTGRS